MVVYKIFNSKTGKVYIGKTERALEQRLKEHHWNAKRGQSSKLYSSIRKYGIEAFEVEILTEAKNRSQLDELEQVYIEQYNSYTHGYNMTKGGDGGDTISNKTIEEKRKQGSFYKGQPAWNKGLRMKELYPEIYENREGRKWTEEQRRAVSVRVKSSPVHQDSYKTRAHGNRVIIKDSLGNTFQYQKDLCKHLNLSRHLVKQVLEQGEYKGVTYVVVKEAAAWKDKK